MGASPTKALENDDSVVDTSRWGAPPAFGHAVLAEFDLAPNYINVNQGSYGSTPRKVRHATEQYVLQVEANPDLWFRVNMSGSGESIMVSHLARSRGAVARYVNASESDVVFVDNASHGISAVLRSVVAYLSRHPSRRSALHLDVAYGEVRDALAYLSSNASCDSSRLQIVEVQTLDLFSLPPQNDTSSSFADMIVQRVSNALDAHPDVGFATFSHVTSTPAVALPVRELAALCRERGVLTLIDGAHAPGQLVPALDVPSIGADFYVGNGHKHLFTSRGVAFLWADPDNDAQRILAPLVVDSLGASGSPFELAFNYQGTTDDPTRYVAAEAALRWRSWLSRGDDAAIARHNRDLARDACALLADEYWHTRVLLRGTENVDSIALCNVQLPCSRPDDDVAFLHLKHIDNDTARVAAPFDDNTNVAKSAPNIHNPPCPDDFDFALYHRYNFYAPIYTIPGAGSWMRLTAQVYLELDDFRVVGAAVLEALGLPVPSSSS